MIDPSYSHRYNHRVNPLLPASFASRVVVDVRPPSRMMVAGREPEIDQQPRKRIAVACGRCRKRKIRCSGDPGNGEPCTNCRNAKAEPCQFLRVASQETPIRHDRGSFSYDAETARNHHARQPAFSPPTVAHNMPDGHGLARYSSATAASFYSTPPAWAAVSYNTDDVVNYAAMSTCGLSCYAHEQAAPYSHSVAPTGAIAARPFNHSHDDDHHHGSMSNVPSVQSASSSAGDSPTDSLHYAAYNHTSSLASSNSHSHSESISTGCSSGTYTSSIGSLSANTEPLVPGYSVRNVHSIPCESSSMGPKSLPFTTGRVPSGAASTTDSSTSPGVWNLNLSVLLTPEAQAPQPASAPIR